MTLDSKETLWSETVSSLIEDLRSRMHVDGKVRLYVKPARSNQFTVLVHVRDHYVDLVSSRTGVDPERTAADAIEHIRRRLAEEKDRRVSARHRVSRALREPTDRAAEV